MPLEDLCVLDASTKNLEDLFSIHRDSLAVEHRREDVLSSVAHLHPS